VTAALLALARPLLILAPGGSGLVGFFGMCRWPVGLIFPD
jgi:hypothetical protein